MLIDHLQCDRLSQRRRDLLTRAAIAPMPVSEGAATTSKAWGHRYAAHGLQRLGLAELPRLDGVSRDGRQYRTWPNKNINHGGGLLHVVLTDLGRLVVEVYRRELETGRPIRWAKLKRHLAKQAAAH